MLSIKKLIVFNADVSRMGWHRRREPPPVPKGACEVGFHWLEHGSWKRNPAILETPEEVVATRFSESGRCLVGQDSRARTVYHLWLMPAGTYVGWIGKRLSPPAGGMLVSDAWVDPAHRGGNVHRWGAALAVRELVRLGGNIVTAGVEEHEFSTMAAMYARLGLGICVPHYCCYWLAMSPGLNLHWRWPPSQELRGISRRLQHAHGDAESQAGGADRLS